MENPPFLIGYTSSKGGFSMAMLDYRSVATYGKPEMDRIRCQTIFSNPSLRHTLRQVHRRHAPRLRHGDAGRREEFQDVPRGRLAACGGLAGSLPTLEDHTQAKVLVEVLQ